MQASDLNIPSSFSTEEILDWMADTEEMFAQKVIDGTLYLVTEDEGNFRMYRIWVGGGKTQVSVEFNATDAKAAIRELFKKFTNATALYNQAEAAAND